MFAHKKRADNPQDDTVALVQSMAAPNSWRQRRPGDVAAPTRFTTSRNWEVRSMKRTIIVLAAVVSVALFLAAPVEAQGRQYRQRGRYRSATEPAVLTRQQVPATQTSTVTPTSAPDRRPRLGRGFGWGMGFGPPPPMRTIHSLLSAHLQIDRQVRAIPGGVETITTSDDPAVARLIQTHVAEMQQALLQGRPVRQWDPLFVELFAHREMIRMEIEQLANGVKVRQVSDNEQVTKLVRQHAWRGVSEFVADGWGRVHQPTPLPDDYEPALAE
jgi:hypothetical protein